MTFCLSETLTRNVLATFGTTALLLLWAGLLAQGICLRKLRLAFYCEHYRFYHLDRLVRPIYSCQKIGHCHGWSGYPHLLFLASSMSLHSRIFR
jgi:hypothetical protein